MKEQEYKEAVIEIVFYFFVAPVIILVGMFVVGAIIDAFMDTEGTFSKLFLYIGGIPGVATYYYKKLKEFNKSKVELRKDNK